MQNVDHFKQMNLWACVADPRNIEQRQLLK